MKKLIPFLAMLLHGQQTIDAPPMAHVLMADGRLTPIHGLAGNFVTGRPGPALLAYSNDGTIEWRLEPGRLYASRDERTATFPTGATRAIFRGDTAILPESNEVLRLTGDGLQFSSAAPNPQVAGRDIAWRDGQLRVVQPDGVEDAVDCPQEPESMTAAAANWVHLVIDGRSHLLRLTPGRVELLVLPQRRRE